MIDPDSYLKRKRSATRGEIKQREALKEKLKDIEIIMTGESLKGIKRKRNELALQADKALEDEIKRMGSEWVEPKKRVIKRQGKKAVYKPIEGDPFGILNEPPVDMKELIKDL